MKYVVTLVTAMLLTSCAGNKPFLIPVTETPKATVGGSERAGLKLTETEIQIPSLTVERVAANAKFTQLLQLLPGADMRKAHQPATLNPGDILIGVNEKLLWQSADELLSAVRDVYQRKSMITLQVLDSKTGALKNIFAGDKHTLNDLTLKPQNKSKFSAIRVSDVRSESWAASHNLRSGDLIISKIQFRSAIIRRSRFPIVIKVSRSESPVKETLTTDTQGLENFLNLMFADVKPYQPNHSPDGVMGYATLLRLWRIRDNTMTHLELYKEKYVGLGVQFGCLPYCGKAEPVIRTIAADSPAQKALLEVNDLVISINGKKISNSWDALKAIRKLNYGDKIVCRVLRKNQLIDAETIIGWTK